MMLRKWLTNLFRPRNPKTVTIRGGLLKGTKKELQPSSYFQAKWGLSERELHPHFRRLAKGIRTAIDIGAAEGDYSLYFLKKTSAKKVIAFEPQEYLVPAIRNLLRTNNLENDPRLEFHQKFLGSAENNCDDTLDAFAEGVDEPCLVKMDVERNELAILKGCPKLLGKDIRWVIEIHTPELDQKCRALLESHGYRVRSVLPSWWRAFLPELRGEYVQWMVAYKPQVLVS